MHLVKPTDSILGPRPNEIASVASVHRAQRNAAVVTAVEVARDWALEQYGDSHTTPGKVREYIHYWLTANGADRHDPGYREAIGDLVDAVWALAELEDADPLTLVDDDYRGTSDEARTMLTNQYERDLAHALNRITWKDR